MPEGSGSGRGRLFIFAIALCGCVLGLTAGSARADGGTINVMYTTNSLQVKLDNGTVVGSGTVIPAGSYTVQVYDSGDFPNPKFTMAGPGVSVSSDLNSTGMGIDVPSTFGPFNLATSSGYTISDANMGASSRVAFNTSATATAGGGTGSGGTGSGGTGSGGTGSGGSGSTGTGSTGGSHTGGTTTLATFAASLSTAGKAALMMSGKPVKTVKKGAYNFKVTDRSKKLGLVVGHGTKKIALSGASKVGTSSHTVTLTTGTWWFAASPGGARVFFTVR